MEMALGFRFTAQRFHEIGFVNRLVDADRLMPEAMAMAEHLMSLPPASRVNTVHMMRQMRPKPSPAHQRPAAALPETGDKNTRMKSPAASAETRKPPAHAWPTPPHHQPIPT